MRGCRFFNSFCTVCVSRGVRVCSSTCGPSSDADGQGVGLPLRCAVLFVFLMLDTAPGCDAVSQVRLHQLTPPCAKHSPESRRPWTTQL